MTMHTASPSPLPRTTTAQLPGAPPGTTVRLQGWVHRRRDLSSVTFLVLRDAWGTAQVVLNVAERENSPSCGHEDVVEVVGTLTANPSAPGGCEIVNPTVTVLSAAEEPPPVELWRPTLQTSLPTLLDHAAVLWRHPAQRAHWEIAAASLHGFRRAGDEHGFTEVRSPSFVSSATESGANVFAVDYFGRPAYLAQSPQFYKQQLVGVFERVYEVGPVFRAEPHDTVRHLSEYTSLDVEMGFIADHLDVLNHLGVVLRTMLEAVTTRAATAVERLGVTLPVIPEDIPRLHFRDALARVGAEPSELDLSPAHERALGAWAREELGSDVLAVTGYPAAKRPFYTHPEPGDDRWTNSFDLLFRGMELVTGGQRLHRYPDYVQAIAARGEDPEEYASYLQCFRHGMPPHGGFAIGLERWVGRLVGAENIREVTLFPRDLHRLTP